LTKETSAALKITSRSTALCIDYLLNEANFHFMLTRPLNSDPLEQFFGSVRQLMGGDFQCHAVAATQAVEKILRTGIAYCSIDSNAPLNREKDE
jgi:hypothetical protein